MNGNQEGQVAYEMSREERYRKRADELRTIADGLTSESARQTVLNVAAEYEELATSARHLPQPNRTATDP